MTFCDRIVADESGTDRFMIASYASRSRDDRSSAGHGAEAACWWLRSCV